jgi:hypothetical protein
VTKERTIQQLADDDELQDINQNNEWLNSIITGKPLAPNAVKRKKPKGLRVNNKQRRAHIGTI